MDATSPTIEFGMGALGIGCPEGPQDLTVAQNGASLDLSWDIPPGARAGVDYYIVYRDTASVPLTPIATVDAPTTTYNDIGIPVSEVAPDADAMFVAGNDTDNDAAEEAAAALAAVDSDIGRKD